MVSLPGSKSLTNRALVLAALADGPSVVRRALRSRDQLLAQASALLVSAAAAASLGVAAGASARPHGAFSESR